MGYRRAAIASLFLVQVFADDAHRGIAAVVDAGVGVQASDAVWITRDIIGIVLNVSGLCRSTRINLIFLGTPLNPINPIG